MKRLFVLAFVMQLGTQAPVNIAQAQSGNGGWGSYFDVGTLLAAGAGALVGNKFCHYQNGPDSNCLFSTVVGAGVSGLVYNQLFKNNLTSRGQNRFRRAYHGTLSYGRQTNFRDGAYSGVIVPGQRLRFDRPYRLRGKECRSVYVYSYLNNVPQGSQTLVSCYDPSQQQWIDVNPRHYQFAMPAQNRRFMHQHPTTQYLPQQFGPQRTFGPQPVYQPRPVIVPQRPAFPVNQPYPPPYSPIQGPRTFGAP